MQHITATLINLYIVCPRECWLHANGITMEHNSELVSDGRLLHETAYPQRAERYSEILIDGAKIDFYDPKNKVIHEIKRSNKMETAHEWQLKYYIYVLLQKGVDGVIGILEYPTLRETKKIILEESDKIYLQQIIHNIQLLIKTPQCPPLLHSKICKTCSYQDFCYATESPLL